MARLHDIGWYVIQGKSTVYSKEFHEGKLDQGEAQWRDGRTLWSR